MTDLIQKHLAQLKDNIMHFLPTENADTIIFRIEEELKSIVLEDRFLIRNAQVKMDEIDSNFNKDKIDVETKQEVINNGEAIDNRLSGQIINGELINKDDVIKLTPEQEEIINQHNLDIGE